jgi:hypothetical protein
LTIAILGFIYLWYGYQMMLGHLNIAKPDRTSQAAELAQNVGMFRIYQTLQDISTLLKQKLP